MHHENHSQSRSQLVGKDVRDGGPTRLQTSLVRAKIEHRLWSCCQRGPRAEERHGPAIGVIERDTLAAFGRLVKRLRQARDLTREELAERAHG